MLAFRATQRVTPRPNRAAEREAVCRGCEWLANETCRHPSRACGCPANAIRVKPWAKLRACPAKAW